MNTEYPAKKRTHKIIQKEMDIDVPDGDIHLGYKIFSHFCLDCHNLDDCNNHGPAIRSVYNRRAGIMRGYRRQYSRFIRHGQFFWTKRKLFEFLENPEEMFPDTHMIFEGLKDPWDRACVIEYLNYLKLNKHK